MITGVHATDVTAKLLAFPKHHHRGKLATKAVDKAETITGGCTINVVNNGAAVAVTETGTGSIIVVNNGQVLTATNTGNVIMTINSTATGAVTVTNTGNGNTTVNASGEAAITITHTGDDDISYP